MTAWLKSVCSSDPKRPSIHAPMVFSNDGRTFTVATDGHRLVELPLSVEDSAENYARPVEVLDASLRNKVLVPTPDSAIPLDLSAFRRFIHDQTCRHCNGDVGDPAFAYIGGDLFNAFKFEPMVSHLPDTGNVRWFQLRRREQALIDGGSWRFIVMPCNDSGNNEHCPRFIIPGVPEKAL